MKLIVLLAMLSSTAFANAETLNIKMNSWNPRGVTYPLAKSGWLKIPTWIPLKTPQFNRLDVKITYNLNKNGDYEFYCLYSMSSYRKNLTFNKCVAQSGQTIVDRGDDLMNMEFPVDAGKSIKIETIKRAETPVTITARHYVDWK